MLSTASPPEARCVGSNVTAAVVSVTSKPRLVITEAHSTGSSAVGGQDWWELTNLGDFLVNLRGCRFDDNSQSLASAITFTNDLAIMDNTDVFFKTMQAALAGVKD